MLARHEPHDAQAYAADTNFCERKCKVQMFPSSRGKSRPKREKFGGTNRGRYETASSRLFLFLAELEHDSADKSSLRRATLATITRQPTERQLNHKALQETLFHEKGKTALLRFLFLLQSCRTPMHGKTSRSRTARQHFEGQRHQSPSSGQI